MNVQCAAVSSTMEEQVDDSALYVPPPAEVLDIPRLVTSCGPTRRYKIFVVIYFHTLGMNFQLHFRKMIRINTAHYIIDRYVEMQPKKLKRACLLSYRFHLEETRKKGEFQHSLIFRGHPTV